MSEKKAYWLLTTEFPPFFGGGISTYCRETVSMLSSNGYRVTVFLCDPGIAEITCTENKNIRIVRFSPFGFKERKILGYETLISFAFSQVLKTFIENEGKPFVLESQDYNGIAYFTLLYKKLLYSSFKDLTVIITIHAPSFICLHYNHVAQYKIPYFWIGEMEKFCMKSADLVIAPSHFIANQIIARAPEIELKHSVLYNPFRLQEVARPDQTAVEPRQFVFYGKASPLKGIFELLRYFVNLWDAGEKVVLRLIGGVDHYYHPERALTGDIISSRYQKYIESNELIIEGEIPPAELKGKIASALAIIIPSKVDNLPYAVIECMALGKIVLATVSGGHKELIIDGVNGFLFSHNEPKGFEDKIRQIIALDSISVLSIGKEAMATVSEHCNPDRIFIRKERLIGDLAENNKENRVFPFLRQLPVNNEAGDCSARSVKGLLSVVIPFYNMGDYIGETINSVLNASYKDIEIIIVNDGSNEKKSIEKLQELEKRPGITIIHQANEGLSVARNRGAFKATGELLAFLDADDIVTPGYYQKAIEILQNYDNVFFAGSWVRYFEEADGVWPCFTPEPPFVLYHNMINTSALVYKKECFLQYGQNDKEMIFGLEDYDSLLGLLENGCNGVAIPEPLFHYRVRKNSMARRFTPEKILYLHERIAVKHKKLYGIFAAEINNLLNANGPGFGHDNPTLDLHISARTRILKQLMGSKGMQYIKQNKRLKKTIIRIRKIIKNI